MAKNSPAPSAAPSGSPNAHPNGEMFDGTPFRKVGKGLVNKASQIILAREKGDLDLIDRKTFNYLINRVYPELRLSEPGIHRVPVADVLEYLGHSSTDRLHESLSRLGSVEILIDYKDENDVPHSAKAHYLSYNMAKAVDGWIHFAFDPILLGFLRDPAIFATLSLTHMRKFRSVYSTKLYEIMSLYVNRQYPDWLPTVQEFREMMCVTEGYDRFDNLRKRVIESAVAEVNEIAPFDVTVEYMRSGRGGKTTALRFTATRKQTSLLDYRMVADPVGRARHTPRDPNTPDMLDGRTDAERGGPAEVTVAALDKAVEMIGEDGVVEAFLEQWRESMRGRRVRDPDRSFLNWLDLKLAKQREDALSILEEDTFSTLLSMWEGTR